MTHAEPSIPSQVRATYETIVALTDRFCQPHLSYEYQMMCRRLAGVLARKRPSPLTRGKPEIWACGIIRVIGWVNFLADSSQKLHMKMPTIDRAFGVPPATGQSKSKAIRDRLEVRRFDPEWTLPSRRNRLQRDLTLPFTSGLLTVRFAFGQ